MSEFLLEYGKPPGMSGRPTDSTMEPHQDWEARGCFTQWRGWLWPPC